MSQTPQPAKPQPRRRHLMDPANPQPQPSQSMSLSQVQRWVMSVLAVTTVMHFSAGLVLAAAFLDTTRPGAQIGLVVIAAIVGVLGVAAGFLIHQKSPFTPWLVLGVLPAAVGLYFIL